jgi:hypothetical protein
MNFEKDLFDICKETGASYDTYVEVLAYVKGVDYTARGEENGYFYQHITNLQNSINNAGCEDRRSAQISYLFNVASDISEKYENFLP